MSCSLSPPSPCLLAKSCHSVVTDNSLCSFDFMSRILEEHLLTYSGLVFLSASNWFCSMFILLPVPKGCFLMWERSMHLLVFAIWCAVLLCVIFLWLYTSAHSLSGNFDSACTAVRICIWCLKLPNLPWQHDFSLLICFPPQCILEEYELALGRNLWYLHVKCIAVQTRTGDQACDLLRRGNYGKRDLLGYKLLISFQKQNTLIFS